MKILSSFLLALAAVVPAAAQQSAGSDFNGWGVRASLDVTMPSKATLTNGDKFKLFSSGAGVSAGVVYNYPFAGDFYIESGVSLFYDTYKYSDITIAIDWQTPGDVVNPAVKKFGVRVPLTVGYRFFIGNNFDFSLYTGPEVSYALVGRIDMSKLYGDESVDDNMFASGGHRRFDCGWKVGVGFPFGRWVVSLEGMFGFMDQLNTDWSYRNRRLSFTVGYDF